MAFFSVYGLSGTVYTQRCQGKLQSPTFQTCWVAEGVIRVMPCCIELSSPSAPVALDEFDSSLRPWELSVSLFVWYWGLITVRKYLHVYLIRLRRSHSIRSWNFSIPSTDPLIRLAILKSSPFLCILRLIVVEVFRELAQYGPNISDSVFAIFTNNPIPVFFFFRNTCLQSSETQRIVARRRRQSRVLSKEGRN